MSLDVLTPHCHAFDLGARRKRLVGVYFLIAEGVVVYVGQTADLETRIELHQWENVKVFDRAMWIELSADDLSAYEGALIRALDPKYNDTAPAFRGQDDAVLARLGIVLSADRRAALDAQGWRHKRKPTGIEDRIAARDLARQRRRIARAS